MGRLDEIVDGLDVLVALERADHHVGHATDDGGGEHRRQRARGHVRVAATGLLDDRAEQHAEVIEHRAARLRGALAERGDLDEERLREHRLDGQSREVGVRAGANLLAPLQLLAGGGSDDELLELTRRALVELQEAGFLVAELLVDVRLETRANRTTSVMVAPRYPCLAIVCAMPMSMRSR